LSSADPDINIDYVTLETFCKEFNKENIFSRVEPYFVQTHSEDLFVIKQDQKFRQLHEVEKLKTKKKK